MKSKVVMVLTVLLAVFLVVGCGSVKKASSTYPEKQITAIVPFGAGGSTDITARVISPLAEEHLKQAIVVKNVGGGNGSIGAKEVLDKNADGYTVFITAENLASYKVMGTSSLSFADYEPILLLARAVPVIVTKADSKYTMINELVQDATQKSGQIKIATTGPTGVSGIVSTLLGVKFNMIPFKSEGEILSALLGGHVEIATVGLLSAADYVKAGKLKVLAVVDDKKLTSYPNWPALGEAMPQYKKNLPWGPFYGVWVKKGTPETVLVKLKDAFAKAAQNPKFKEFLAKNEMLPLSLTGADAIKYANDFTSKTAWLLYEGGAAKKSPADLGIPKRE